MAAIATLALAGCGSDGEPPAKPVERPEETFDTLPELAPGYVEFENRDAGVAFGRPPGWKADANGGATTLTAPDELVAVAISADRTDDAVALDPKEFAAQAAEALPGFAAKLATSKARPFAHRYTGAVVMAEGVAKGSGVVQRIQVIALERQGIATVSAVIFENRERDPEAEIKQALEAIRTLRTRPPS
ncbi:MAG: hypothetical protein M3355_06560 [Actinomycetota bacterium]|nr:hypothetical protein [Actinomycetota bacterium]